MAQKKKRRLTNEEIQRVREAYEKAPMGKKPTIRQIARAFKINQPSVVKSLGGWKNIQRGKPVPPPTEHLLEKGNIPTPQITRGTFEDGKIKEIDQ